MKKYFLTIAFFMAVNTANASDIKICANGSCQNLDAQRDYPQVYTAIYGIFKNGIAENMAICDSDSLFEECEKNGINYLGEVGVSETNFHVNALNVVDARINPQNRNLEIINDYYTFVNGKRVLCSAAKDVLTLQDGEVSLIAKNIKCPYNMQFKSEKDHKYTIRMIDLDKKIIGVEYEIKDYIGANSNPRGYAIINFRDIPTIDFNEINKTIAQDYTPAHNNYRYNTNMSGVTPPPAGMTSHIPTAPTMGGHMNYNWQHQAPSQSTVNNQYQQQIYAMSNSQANANTYAVANPSQAPMMQGQYAPMVPPAQPSQEFSYKSELPYPWGYYYAPNSMPQEKPKKQIPVINEDKAKSKNYTVAPLPKTMIEIDTSGNAVKTTVNQPDTSTIAVEESVGIFNVDTFNNSVPK